MSASNKLLDVLASLRQRLRCSGRKAAASEPAVTADPRFTRWLTPSINNQLQADGSALRKPCNVLLAAAHPANCLMPRNILERAGHRCTLVQNGEQALDHLMQQDFDAAAIDIGLPLMNGLEVVKAYRFMRAPDLRIPIVLLLDSVTADTEQECRKAGVDEILGKPVAAADFIAALERMTGKPPARRREASLHATTGRVVAEPAGQEPVLNYAMLAELEKISPDPGFLDGLLGGFIEDNQALVNRLEQALHSLRHGECREIMHALKGSAVSIGAMSLKLTCQRFEQLTSAELARDAQCMQDAVKTDFSKLCEALQQYREKRGKPGARDC